MSVNLSDWKILTDSIVDKFVDKNRPGVYGLAVAYDGIILYVGRSDSDLNGRLKTHISEKSLMTDRYYLVFKFIYANSPKNAYEMECSLWHKEKPLDNKIHPNKPEGTTYPCPICGK